MRRAKSKPGSTVECGYWLTQMSDRGLCRRLKKCSGLFVRTGEIVTKEEADARLVERRLRRRMPLMLARRFLDSSRRSREAVVGLVGRRLTGTTAACRINSISRSSASWRLRSWVRWRCAVMTSTPSLGEPAAGEPHQPRAHVVRQRRRAAHVEAQLHRGRELVDVLPARPGGADEAAPRARARRWLMDRVMRIMPATLQIQPFRYCFASTLPSSTAGWSNGSTPSRCAAMIVSSMKCISSSPRLVSSSCSMWMVRTGQPFLASVSAVARPCAATRSPMVLPAKSGSPASAARSAVDARAAAGGAGGDDGEQLVARAGDEELQLAVLVDRARARAIGVVPLPSLPRLSAQSCTYQRVKRSSRSA